MHLLRGAEMDRRACRRNHAKRNCGSWSHSARHEPRGSTLELMVEPRRGWTKRVFQEAYTAHTKTDLSYVAFFSGPHGRPVSVNSYGTVLLIASGLGIMAQIPYLQHLTRSFHNHSTRARRLHWICQLHHLHP